jgi:hypothetical protein
VRPRPGELIAAACGVLLLVALLLPWYGRDTDIAGAVISETWTAWKTLPVVAVALFLVAVIAIAVPAARVLGSAPASFRGDRVLVILGVVGVALVLFRLIDMPIPDIELQGGDHTDSSRGPGLFLALLATAGIAFGGWLVARAGPR